MMAHERMRAEYLKANAEAIELGQWRLLGPRCLEIVNRELARQGDHAERELIELQHALAELLQPLGQKTTQPKTSHML